MSFPILFREVARVEFDSAAYWYEHRRAGLGAAFTASVERVLDRIAKQPDAYARVYQDVREALVPRYPYCIYYRFDGSQVLVLAVFHTSRDPSDLANARLKPLGLRPATLSSRLEMPAALLAWSSGKDSAWALEILRREGRFDVVGLVTTFNEAFDRVAMHAVRRELVDAQAAAAGLPLWPMFIPWPCPNGEYERRLRALLAEARRQGITHFAFGDLYLEDVRRYRENLFAESGIEPVFPIWCSADETPALARQMLAAGLSGVITCVDPKQLDGRFVGRRFDAALLDELPPGVDRCGERGEFHTFCDAGPMFSRHLNVEVGEVVQRDGFWFADILPAARFSDQTR